MLVSVHRCRHLACGTVMVHALRERRSRDEPLGGYRCEFCGGRSRRSGVLMTFGQISTTTRGSVMVGTSSAAISSCVHMRLQVPACDGHPAEVFA
jgi:hypothetical protein